VPHVGKATWGTSVNRRGARRFGGYGTTPRREKGHIFFPPFFCSVQKDFVPLHHHRQNMEIRAARPEDAAALLGIYAPYVEKTAITFEYEVPTEEEFRQRIATISRGYPYLIAEEDGHVVGYAYASAFKERAAYQWAVETSIYVEEQAKRKGIGRQLHDALEEALKARGILNMNACISYIEPEDEYLTLDSVRFHERMGYQEVAHFHLCGRKFGRWYDMVWMEKLIGEHSA